MVAGSFTFTRTPKLVFGPGAFKELPGSMIEFGSRSLIITGALSFRKSRHWDWLQGVLKERGFELSDAIVTSEPDPDTVDRIVAAHGSRQLDLVVAIGGGSVIDAGKAVAAMLPLREPVTEYVEGIGNKKHPGVKIPFIAVPTTSGTGTEATKNASLRRLGDHGFKKSLRHDNFVPDVALVDPELALSCPARVTAACGMDALSQLLESYVSPRSSPITDALACSGLLAVRNGLIPAYEKGAQDINARAYMAYASFLSGITLANAGLGIVHSFSSQIGGYFDIPHGVICGRLLAAGMKINIACMCKKENLHSSSLHKHALAGEYLTGIGRRNDAEGCEDLVNVLANWAARLAIPRLSEYGIRDGDFDRILAGTANRDNPVELSRKEMYSILEESL